MNQIAANPVAESIVDESSQAVVARRLPPTMVEEIVDTPPYRHVPFPVIGSTRARLGIVQRLPVRRIVIEDDTT